AIGLDVRDQAMSDADSGVSETILSGKAWFGSVENRRKDGSPYTEETTITPVLDDAKRVGAYILIKSDVTERERNRLMLEASVEEKSELLREIHHRVNNNMQLIISLLSLYLGRIDDPGLKKMIEDISMRLVSMASIHEEFYNSADLTRIDFRAYLQQLVANLRGEFPRFDGSLSVSSESGTAFLRLEKALPAGLVATELLVNAIRFAYPGDARPGPIVVAIRREGDRYALVVRDEGAGLGGSPAGSIDGLGFTLVRSLSAQLHGEFELCDRGGVEAALRFSVE
ncbi:MAG: histidine kinase dimerization/phosphoacceptor domain -containing protein, partial [Spirochaetaceae bacterium]|nr:histidine kinase dimerization/phosphoacceptor domain -containing protein [Spirochaetaceae bacterium]